MKFFAALVIALVGTVLGVMLKADQNTMAGRSVLHVKYYPVTIDVTAHCPKCGNEWLISYQDLTQE